MNRKRGPAKEKGQKTIRIDLDLLKAVEAQAGRENGTRPTDLIERGLVLALEEQDKDLPLLSMQVRFTVANANKEQQKQLRRFLALLVWEDVATLSENERLIKNFFLDWLKQFDKIYPKAIDVYRKYRNESPD